MEVLDWSHYDDLWFLRAAEHIRAGRWMGPYGELTLIKGVAYPMWIALVSSLGLPLLPAQQLLYACACIALHRALAPALESAGWRAALFMVVLFNPMTFANGVATRVLREGIYPAMALLTCAGVAGTLLRLGRVSRHGRRGAVPWSVLAGTALAVFWHTREEGVWLVPMLAAGAFATIGWTLGDYRARWREAATVLAIPLAAFTLAWAGIAGTNYVNYGVLATCEFKERSFLRAYGALSHVRKQHPVPMNPVPKEVRERVYAVSPAFAELRRDLEGSLGQYWVELSVEQVKGDLGGQFMWAFRQAVSSAGYYDRGAHAVRDYYDRVTREIDGARRAGRLEARPGSASIRPEIAPEYHGPVLRAWARGLISVARFGDFTMSSAFSTEGLSEAPIYTSLTRTQLAPAHRIVKRRLIGWIVHVDGPVSLRIETAHGKSLEGAIVTRTATPGLYEHLKRSWKPFPPARHAGFDIITPAQRAFLVVSLKGKVIERIDLGHVAPTVTNAGIRMSLDRIDTVTTERRTTPDAVRRNILMGIGRTYQWGFPIFLVTAVCAYAARIIRAPGAALLSLPLIITAGLMGAVTVRVLILALIDVTTFPALNSLYQSPSHGLMLAAAVILAHDAFNGAGRSWWERNGSPDRSAGSDT